MAEWMIAFASGTFGRLGRWPTGTLSLSGAFARLGRFAKWDTWSGAIFGRVCDTSARLTTSFDRSDLGEGLEARGVLVSMCP